jgi:hypothetical protein
VYVLVRSLFALLLPDITSLDEQLREGIWDEEFN